MLAAVPPPGCDPICVIDYWRTIDRYRMIYPCVETLGERWETIYPWVTGYGRFRSNAPLSPSEIGAGLNPVEAHLVQHIFEWGRWVAQHGYQPVVPSTVLRLLLADSKLYART